TRSASSGSPQICRSRRYSAASAGRAPGSFRLVEASCWRTAAARAANRRFARFRSPTASSFLFPSNIQTGVIAVCLLALPRILDQFTQDSTRERRLAGGGRRRLLSFQHDLGGILVGLQPLVHRGTEGAGPGPLAELDLADELRLHEDRLLGWLTALEGGRRAAQRLELSAELPKRLLAETGADPAGVMQPRPLVAVLVVADENGADRALAPALPG